MIISVFLLIGLESMRLFIIINIIINVSFR